MAETKKRMLNRGGKIGGQKNVGGSSASPSSSGSSDYSVWDGYLKRKEEEEKKNQGYQDYAQAGQAQLADTAQNSNAQDVTKKRKDTKTQMNHTMANYLADKAGNIQPYADAWKIMPESVEKAREMGATATALRKDLTHKHVLETEDPYDLGNDVLNQMYADNLKAAEGWNVKTWDGLNPKDDIRDITRRWYENRNKSQSLNWNNPEGKDPMGAADKLMQKELDALRAKYESNGRSYAEQRELMAANGMRDPYQIEDENKKTAIREAYNAYNAENPNAQAEWRRMFKDAQAERKTMDVSTRTNTIDETDQAIADALDNAEELIGKMKRQGINALTEEELYALDELRSRSGNPDAYGEGISTQEGMDALAALGHEMANEMRGTPTHENIQVPRRVMDYADADQYLRERKGDDYAIARDTPDKAEQIIGLLENAGDTIRKLQETGRNGLTEDELYALDAIRDASGNPDAFGAGIRTEEGVKALEDVGKALAQRLREQAALYHGPQEWDTYQQGLWEAMIGTQEGADYYLRNATGTEQESRAKENKYWADQTERIRAAKADPEFDALSKPQGNDGDLNKKMDLMSSKTYADYMTDEEKEIYYYYLNTGNENEARKYLEALKYSMNERSLQASKEYQQGKINRQNIFGLIGENLWSVPESVLGGTFGFVDLIGQNWGNVAKPDWMPDWLWRGINPYSYGRDGEYKPVDTNSEWQWLSADAKTTREETSKKVAELSESIGVGSYLPVQFYNGVMSLLDSRFGAKAMQSIFGSTKAASTLGAFLTGTRSGQEYMLKAYQNGGTDEQALLMGLTAGFFECAWEKVELSIFLRNAEAIGTKSAWERFVELGLVTLENGIQEGATEQTDMMAEHWIMGDLSEMEQIATYLSDMGMNEDEIKQAITDYWLNNVWDATVGGLIMGGTSDVAAQGMSVYRTNQYYKDIGRAMADNGTTQMVYDMAKESTDSDVKKALRGYDPTKANAKQTGQLYSALANSLPAEMRGRLQGAMRDNVNALAQDILAPLTDEVLEASAAARAGEQLSQEQQKALQDYSEGRAVADVIAAMFAQEELTPEQISTLAASEKGMELVRSIWGETQNKDQNEEAQQGRQEQEGQQEEAEEEEEWEAMPRANESAENEEAREGMQQDQNQTTPTTETREGMQQDQNQTTPTTETREGIRQDQAQTNPTTETREGMQQDQAKTNPTTETREGIQQDQAKTEPITETREGIRQTPAQAQPDNQAVPVTRLDADGNKTQVRVTFRTTENGMEAVDENGEARDAAELDLTDAQQAALQEAGALGDDRAANDLMAMLDGVEDEKEAEAKAKAYGEAYRQGVDGVPFDERGKLWDELSDEEAQRAYDLGKEKAQEQQAARVNLARQAARADGYRADADAGADEAGVFYGNVSKNVTSEQGKTMLRLLDQYAKDNGVHIVVHDGMGNLNGTYRKGDKTVHVSLSADDGNLTRVATHEIFHYIKDENPEAGQQLQDFILDALRNKEGYDLEQRISDIQEAYRTAKGQELTREEAMEEIAADAMGDVIGTEENLRRLVRSEQVINPGDLSLAERLKKWLGKMVERFRALQRKFQKSSPEGLALKDETDKMEKMRDMYETILDAIKKNRAEGKAGLYSGIAQDADVQEYLEEKNSAATKEDADAALNGLLSTLFANTQQAWIGANADNYEQGYADFVDALGKFGRGDVGSVAAAMIRKGLAAPMGQKENQLYSYAARQIAENEKNQIAAEDAKFSIKQLPDGTQYVHVDADQDIFDNAKESDYRKIARQYIRDHFKGNQYRINQTGENIRITGRSANEYAYPANRRINENIKNAKLRASTDLDEMIEISEYIGHVDDDGRHTQAVGGWNRYNTVFEMGGYFFKGETQVMLTDEGPLFYDITKIEDITRQLRTAEKMDSRGPDNASDENITNDRKNVNEKLSLSRDADQSQRNREAVENLRQDADLYAQMKQDSDARAAYLLLMQLHDMTTRGGDSALIRKGAYNDRLSEIADEILQKYGSQYSKQKLMRELRKVYQGMEESRYSTSDLLAYAKSVMQGVLEKTPGVVAEKDETTKEIMRILRETPFSLTADQINELHYTYGSALDFRRKNFGKMHIVKDRAGVTSLPTLWTETLNPMLPGVFAADASEMDMPDILDAWLTKQREVRYTNALERSVPEEATDMALSAMLGFYDLPGALKSKGEIVDAARQKWYDQQTQRIDKIKENAKKAVETARERYNERYKERINKAKERREQTEEKQKLRKSIERTVKTINRMVISPNDRRFVPDNIKDAVVDAVRPFLNDTIVFDKDRLERLNSIYSAMEENKDEMAGFDEDILASIQTLGPKLNGRRLSELTAEELSDIDDIVGNVHKIITGANKAFFHGREVEKDTLSGQLKAEMIGRTARQGRLAEEARKISYKETTPVYFGDRMGGVIKEFVHDLFSGMEKSAFTLEKAKKFLNEQIDQYHVNDWINDKETLRFETRHGDTIEMNRRLALSLYALWKRENTNLLQDAHHLSYGGFVYKEGTRYKGVEVTRPHVLTEKDMTVIENWLTAEQMKFADTMVGYLSTELSSEANEVSKKLHGYKKFKEGYYFPYHTDRDYLAVGLTETGEHVGMPKNKGFTKALQKRASTPVTVDDFIKTWREHMNEMSVYLGFAQTMDTMNRVFNDKLKAEVKTNQDTGEVHVTPAESNWAIMRRAIGSEGVNYIKTLARDIAGGIRADERGWAAKGLSRFKKSAVAGNLSVVLQQGTAYARAMMMVSPRYLLAANPAHIAKSVKEMYKYSGIALVKQIGKFDTGMGRSAEEWLTDGINDENAVKQILGVVDEWTGKGAEKADEWTWGLLWDAISKEVEHTRTDLTRGTDKFGYAVAERFNDVVNHTQVYDSVLSRSEWMRSNTTMDKMMTSFMAEPTLTLNMLQDAIVRFKEDGMGAKKVARAAGTFLLNAAMVALAKSLMTATRRKDDEGRTWLEKYLSEAASSFVDDVSPFGIAGMIPGVRDAISIFEGYDVARSDMDSVTMLYKAMKALKSDDKSLEDKIQEASGAVGNLLGVPVKNVWRDLEAMIRNIWFGASANEPSTERDIKYSVLDNLKMGPVDLWDSSRGAYYDRMEQAALKGDTAMYEELYGYMTETNKVKPETVASGVKGELKDSVLNGLVTKDKAIEVLTKTLGMEEKKARDAVDEWIEKAEHAEDEDFEYSKYGELISLAKEGKDIKAELADLEKRGADEKTALGKIKSGIKDWYVSGGTNRETAEKRIKQYITTLDDNALYWLFEEWDAEKNGQKDEYNKYNAFFKALETGNNLKSEAKRLLDHGIDKSTISNNIPSQYKQQYVALIQAGKKTEAANLKARLLTAYEAIGYNRSDKSKAVDNWIKQEEKKNK